MIRELKENEFHSILNFVEQDIARNYFILLGLKNRKKMFDIIFKECNEKGDNAVLLKRTSGVLQFYAQNEFDVQGFSEIISSIEYDSMISPKSFCDKFIAQGIFKTVKEGAYIAKLDREYILTPFNIHHKIRSITVDDLDKIVDLYKNVFNSFSSKEVMEEKLNSGRGRGVCVEEGEKIICVAQTDFETDREAVIVGVATDKSNQGIGLATECMNVLCSHLLKKGKTIYIQYDSPNAGRIYERLGFKIIDQIYHCK